MRLSALLARLGRLEVTRSDRTFAPLLRWIVMALLCGLLLVLMLFQSASAQPVSEPTTPTEAGLALQRPAAHRLGAQRNRLRVGTLVELDGHTRSVGDAIRFLLEPVHYELTTRTVDPEVSDAVLRRPVPPGVNHAGLMSIEAALLLLIGQENRLVVDHINRLVAIERMPADSSAPSN